MFIEFFRLEVRNHLRQPMIYVFFLLIVLLVFGATATNSVSIGEDMTNVNKNSPYVVAQYTVILGIFGILMITAFMDFASLRDYKYNFHHILFSTPIRKGDYLLGRFLGAYVVSLLPFLGVSMGVLLGILSPGVDPEKVGPFVPEAYLYSFLIFVVPNSLFMGALIYFLAVTFKKTTVTFIGAVVVLVAYVTGITLAEDMNNRLFSALLDPSGIVAYDTLTEYWTVAEKNQEVVSMSGNLLLNRLLWSGIGIGILIVTYATFSFSPRKSKKQSPAPTKRSEHPIIRPLVPLPHVLLRFNQAARRQQFVGQLRLEFLSIVRSPSFAIILFIGAVNMIVNVWFVTKGSGDTLRYPVTYEVLDVLQAAMGLYEISVIVLFAGILVWRERDARMDLFFNAYAYPNWIMLLAKVAALAGMITLLQGLIGIVGISFQLAHGFRDFNMSLYFTELFLIDLPQLIEIIILSVLIQVLINHRFLGYAVVVTILFLRGFILKSVFGIHHNLLFYRGDPAYTYSDMSGYGPAAPGVLWFAIYWMLFHGLLLIGCLLLWVRERETNIKSRFVMLRQRFTPTVRYALFSIGGLWLCVGGFIFYNTNILNEYVNPEAQKALQADYEKEYKRYEDVPQPRITAVSYTIDLEPYERNLRAQATMTLKNKSDRPIDSLHLSYPPLGITLTAVDLPRSTLLMADDRLGYRIYRLSSALQPGDSLVMTTHSAYKARGFENEVSVPELSHNGTFFNTSSFVPVIGYSGNNELLDQDDREEYDLPERDRMPSINDSSAYRNSYVASDADWIRMKTTISTASDQVAIAPGSLTHEWKENGRRYFQYTLDTAVLHYSAFISARYEVLKDRWNNVNIEIYYHPAHGYNVERMSEAVKASLEYYTEHFSDYPHDFARIIEFPRYADFAQAFPGTMPYSENIGFIENLEDEDSKDRVLQVVAHEMAHQWWAHQVVGANVQGATLLSETMAQYASLMVMKHAKSEKSVREYRRYEVDEYLRSRGSEKRKEVPLWLVENMPYIHYQKGSNVMFALQEYLGEDRVNQALHDYAQEVAYQEPPYTTSNDLLAHFRAVTPDSLQSLVTDLFEQITLYSNRTEEAFYRVLDEGTYQVDITTVSEKFYADSLGQERSVPVNDWIDVGVYAEGEDGEDELIYCERKKVTNRENTFQIVVNRLPTKAGIDPQALLIDRVPDDNTQSVVLQEEREKARQME